MLQKVGRSVRQYVQSVLYGFGYFGKVIESAFMFVSRGKASRKILIMQLLFTFVEALPIVSLLAMGLGTFLHTVGFPFLQNLGRGSMIYELLVIVITRELGPLLVAFVVTARSATAIATEIGTMVTSHEIESYISIGVDPFDHLVAPRFLGVTASVFLLNIYFSICGLIFPAVIIQLTNPVSMSEYFYGLFGALTIKVMVISMLKSLIFGMLISVNATYYGLAVVRASTEVPIAGIKAVGKTMLGVIVLDAIITALSYLL